MDDLSLLSQSPVRTFGFRLWHVQHAFMRRLEGALLPLGLTHMQFVVLRVADHLAQAGEQPTQARLAVGTATDRMMVSKVLRLLEAKGLVVRPVHPMDARAHHVVLTAAGRRLVAQAMPLALQAQAEYFGSLRCGRLEQLDAILDELLRLDGSPIAASPCVGMAAPGTEGCISGLDPGVGLGLDLGLDPGQAPFSVLAAGKDSDGELDERLT